MTIISMTVVHHSLLVLRHVIVPQGLRRWALVFFPLMLLMCDAVRARIADLNEREEGGCKQKVQSEIISVRE